MEDRLHKFAVLVESGTFTAAAKELHISQPALSVAIRKLETELHTVLFVHGVRTFTLTEAGQMVYREAKEVADHIDRLGVRLRELASTELNVRLGMIDGIAAMLFSESKFIGSFEEQATLSVIVDNTRALLPAVERGDLDLALVTEPVYASSSHLLVRHLAYEPLVLVASAKTNVLFPTRTIDHFISYDQASMTYRIILDGLRKHGLSPNVTFSSTSPEVMLRLVLLGRGMAVLPYLLVRDYVQNGELIMPPAPIVISRGIATAQRRGATLSPALKRISSYVRRELDVLDAEAAHYVVMPSADSEMLPRHSTQSRL